MAKKGLGLPVMRSSRGFTLVELLIAVVMLGVLLSIAVPAYNSYLVRANRAEAQSVLLEVHSRQEQFAASNRAYATSPAALGVTVPAKVSANYDITITAACMVLDAGTCVGATCTVTGGACGCTCTCATGCPRAMTGYTATAAPTAGGSQVADGALSTNQFGLRMPLGRW